ncbi:MAG: cation-translocating P-type ATPase [Spirochaetia bacterium]|jgi:Ca2+-transporting ATPase
MALTEEQVKSLRGLSEAQAGEALRAHGLNELPSAGKRGTVAIIAGVLREPMFLLLLACGALYLALGDVQEAVMLLGFVIAIMGITIYQEQKTENTLSALRDLASPRALVIRGGERRRIPGREVARGDLIVLAEGDRVPADGLLLWEINLSVDESLLTGESVPVRKTSADESAGMQRPGGDDLPCVFSGTLVVHGQGVALVRETGPASEIGRIGRALQAVEQEQTPLQKETAEIVRAIFVGALVLCAALVIVYGLTRRDWLNGLLSGITLAMAVLPEELPVVLTIFLALGAWRISRNNVLARRMAAVETLGAATVLCTDKTGTLTQNRMRIRMLQVGDRSLDVTRTGDLPESFHELLEYGILASQQDPFDPMEKAIHEIGEGKLTDTEHIHTTWTLVQQYPLSRNLLALSHAWSSVGGKGYVVATKGAPEAIADLCHFDSGQVEHLSEQVQGMADRGLRVIGVAKASFDDAELPDMAHDFPFQFIGIMGLEDPIRPTVPDAVRECHEAGIKVVMITGDYPATARKIASQTGLGPGETITGPELDRMSADELRRRIPGAGIFARVVPEQKLAIVEAFKSRGDIVAMTGDGVNDAPALKAAHIGVAMGSRGTDVAREASDLVLLDDDFSSIVAAVRMGRRIFDNLKKAMAYVISVHIPIALVSLRPVLLQWKEMILFPVHIVFLELIIDPACSIVFEAEPAERDIMKRKPRGPGERLFGPTSLIISCLQGLFALGAVIGVYSWALGAGQSIAEARTLAFITLIVSNLCLILTNRSWSQTAVSAFSAGNPALLWVIGGALVFLGLVVYVPGLRDLFHFAPMHALDIVIALGAGLVSIAWFEAAKVLVRLRRREIT